MRKKSPFSKHNSLREALYDMVHNSSIPAKAQAEELGISYSYLCNAANPNLEGFDYQLRLIIPHTRLTQNFAALDYIEQSLGRVAIQIPALGPSPADLIEEFAKTTAEFGDLAREIGQALQDGRVEEDEFKRLEKEGWELIRQTVLLLEKVREAIR